MYIRRSYNMFIRKMLSLQMQKRKWNNYFSICVVVRMGPIYWSPSADNNHIISVPSNPNDCSMFQNCSALFHTFTGLISQLSSKYNNSYTCISLLPRVNIKILIQRCPFSKETCNRVTHECNISLWNCFFNKFIKFSRSNLFRVNLVTYI